MHGSVSSLENTKDKKYRHQTRENWYIIRLILLSPLFFFPHLTYRKTSDASVLLNMFKHFRVCVATAAAIDYLKCNKLSKAL